MKCLLAATTIALITALPAHCRIGESLIDLTTRFGEGKRDTGKMRMAGHEQYYFERDGIGVQCVIGDDTKCVMEVFHRVGSKITDQDLKDLLKTEADGHGWGFNTRTNRWMRSDNALTAYRQPGHEDMFFIEDTATIKERDKAAKGKPGF